MSSSYVPPEIYAQAVKRILREKVHEALMKEVKSIVSEVTEDVISEIEVRATKHIHAEDWTTRLLVTIEDKRKDYWR